MKDFFLQTIKSEAEVAKTAEVSVRIETRDNSVEGRDRLNFAMHEAKYESANRLSEACELAGNVACRKVMQASFTMPTNSSAELRIWCRQTLTPDVEPMPCATAGDTELDPTTVLHEALGDTATE